MTRGRQAGGRFGRGVAARALRTGRATCLAIGLLTAAPTLAAGGQDGAGSGRGTARPADRGGGAVFIVRGESAGPWLRVAPLARGSLGVEVVELTDDLRRVYGAPRGQGVLIARVTEGSPAARADLRVGDVLLAVRGVPLATRFDLRRAVGAATPEARLEVDVLRGGKARRATVEVSSRPARVLDVGALLCEGAATCPRERLLGGPGDGKALAVWPAGRPQLLRREVGEEALPELERAFEQLADPAVRQRLERELARRAALEARIRALEERLRALESELARRPE